MTKLEQDIREEIRQLALTDVDKFIEMFVDVEKLKICRQRKMGKTLQQIAISMQMPKSTVRDKCKTCQ